MRSVPVEALRALAGLRGTDAPMIQVLDVGANPLEVPPYKALLDLGLCHVTGFEPQAEALAELEASKGANETYLPHAIGDGTEATLFITNSSGFTSLFRPLRHVARMLGWHKWMAARAEVPMTTERLDALDTVPATDFLKIDVQGSELAIIRNGRAKLSQAVAVQTEVRFLPIYDGEPRYGQLDNELARQGFSVYDFLTLHRKPFLSHSSRRMAKSAGLQLVDGDALYVRDLARPRRMSDDQLLKLAILAVGVVDRPALAVYCLDLLQARGRLSPHEVESVLALLPVDMFRRGAAPAAVTAQSPDGAPKILFSAVRNEGPFLLEWIAYHRAIGFDRVVVFENDSDDGTTELLAALHEAAVLEHFRHSPPEGVGAQVNAARIANENGVLGQTGWAAWLDADEFLNIHAGAGRLKDLIAHLDWHQGMLIPWRVFGDNGHDRFPGRFLSQDFTRAAKADAPFRNELKTFFRLGDAVAGLSLVGINRPTLHAGRTYPPDLFLCANGNAPDPADRRTRRFYAGEDFVESAQTGEAGDGWILAQINHYLNRTPEHFLKKKYRGNGWKTGVAAANDRRRSVPFYQRMNRNDAEDRSILRHLPATDAEIVRLRSLPGVAEAEAQVLARHAAWLAEHKDEIAEVTGALRRAKAIS